MLLEIKKKWDASDVLYATTAVGSERGKLGLESKDCIRKMTDYVDSRNHRPSCQPATKITLPTPSFNTV
jgi:hypothetical protein